MATQADPIHPGLQQFGLIGCVGIVAACALVRRFHGGVFLAGLGHVLLDLFVAAEAGVIDSQRQLPGKLRRMRIMAGVAVARGGLVNVDRAFHGQPQSVMASKAVFVPFPAAKQGLVVGLVWLVAQRALALHERFMGKLLEWHVVAIGAGPLN
jgi:hypothetical protein